MRGARQRLQVVPAIAFHRSPVPHTPTPVAIQSVKEQPSCNNISLIPRYRFSSFFFSIKLFDNDYNENKIDES